MADSDLIAQVYPVGEAIRTETLKYATHSITCNRRSRPALRPSASRTQPMRGAREATEPLEGANTDTQQDDLNSLPYLELRFSDGPRASTGFVFGKDPDVSDVVLPSIPGISRQHFALTYKNTFEDGRYRLVVRDLGSLRGTTVTYNAKGEHLRRKFDWIIAGFEFPNQAKSIIIQLHDDVKFRIVVAHHDVASSAYISNVERFLQGAAQSDALLGALRLQSGPHTERATAAHTPTNAPVFVNRGVIARGNFGTVSHRWNVSTGEEYGCKKPTEREFSRADWQKEISIMKGVHHSHIVRLCFSTMSPEPRLYLEYMAFGNLLDEFERVPYSFEECCHVLRQSLSALDYLHGQLEPIAHRDLKPQNILVKSREPLHIKLADFGLAKAGHLETHCGTLSYSPPELQSDSRSHRHTVAVDIWSLGVVILEFGYGLPSPGSGSDMSWCVKIAEEASRCELDGLIEILQRMLKLEANARGSAATCLGLTQALCGWTQVPGGSAEGNEAVSWPSGPSSQVLFVPKSISSTSANKRLSRVICWPLRLILQVAKGQMTMRPSFMNRPTPEDTADPERHHPPPAARDGYGGAQSHTAGETRPSRVRDCQPIVGTAAPQSTLIGLHEVWRLVVVIRWRLSFLGVLNATMI
ncbi:kinase-like domain-containing protein [Podospora appendiculata]|uniref:Kinase-like domain-containing protein n=1 Tax=Podospora appendiculata TaxID=314037 RepID=A0AAE0X6X9_9PEZI|nr:kinase-like domain-containing protein [Podospora appendiculata]